MGAHDTWSALGDLPSERNDLVEELLKPVGAMSREAARLFTRFPEALPLISGT